MNDPHVYRRFQRALLYSLVVFVAASAALGVVIVLRNRWSWFETRVVLTTLIAAAASCAGLAADASRSSTRNNFLPNAGLTLTGVATALILVGMWGSFQTAPYWQTTSVFICFAIATVHISLLSVARLANRFRWVYWCACVITLTLAALCSYSILFHSQFGSIYQLHLTLLILSAATTLAIPLLHRLSRNEFGQAPESPFVGGADIASIDAEIARLKQQLVLLQARRKQIASGMTAKESIEVADPLAATPRIATGTNEA